MAHPRSACLLCGAQGSQGDALLCLGAGQHTAQAFQARCQGSVEGTLAHNEKTSLMDSGQSDCSRVSEDALCTVIKLEVWEPLGPPGGPGSICPACQ